MIPLNTTNTKQVVKDAEFNVDLNNPALAHCSYLHIVEYGPDDRRAMYVGSCQFRQLLECPDARKNRAWRQYVAPVERVIIKVLALFDSPYEAANHAALVARETKPYCNVHGERDVSSGRIRCIDDGLEYRNAAAASKFYGISPGAMSNHLNQRPGYSMIRGLCFERIKGE